MLLLVLRLLIRTLCEEVGKGGGREGGRVEVTIALYSISAAFPFTEPVGNYGRLSPPPLSLSLSFCEENIELQEHATGPSLQAPLPHPAQDPQDHGGPQAGPDGGSCAIWGQLCYVHTVAHSVPRIGELCLSDGCMVSLLC